MKEIIRVISVHKDAPAVTGPLDLVRWKIADFTDLDQLISSLVIDLKLFWKKANGKSLAGLMSKKDMLKYLWDRRPTEIEIYFADGTNYIHTFKYDTKDKYSQLFLSPEENEIFLNVL